MSLSVNDYQDYDKWKINKDTLTTRQLPVDKQPPVDKQTPVDKLPPVEPSYEIKDLFGLNAYGGVTGVEGVNGAFGVARKTPSEGLVQDENGFLISYANPDGRVGCTIHASSPYGLKEKPGFVPKTYCYV